MWNARFEVFDQAQKGPMVGEGRRAFGKRWRLTFTAATLIRVILVVAAIMFAPSTFAQSRQRAGTLEQSAEGTLGRAQHLFDQARAAKEAKAIDECLKLSADAVKLLEKDISRIGKKSSKDANSPMSGAVTDLYRLATTIATFRADVWSEHHGKPAGTLYAEALRFGEAAYPSKSAPELVPSLRGLADADVELGLDKYIAPTRAERFFKDRRKQVELEPIWLTPRARRIQFEKALELNQRALAILQAMPGASRDQVRATQVAIGECLVGQERWGDALAQLEPLLGSDDPMVKHTRLFYAADVLTNAGTSSRRVLNKLEGISQDNDAALAGAKEACRSGKDEYGLLEVLSLYRRASDEFTKSMESPTISFVRAFQGVGMYATTFEEMRVAMRRAADLSVSVDGPKGKNTSRVYGAWASYSAGFDQPSEAYDALKMQLECDRDRLSPNLASKRLTAMGGVAAAAQRWSDAENSYREAQKVGGNANDAFTGVVDPTLQYAVKVMLARGKDADAFAELKTVLDMLKTSKWRNNPGLARNYAEQLAELASTNKDTELLQFCKAKLIEIEEEADRQAKESANRQARIRAEVEAGRAYGKMRDWRMEVGTYMSTISATKCSNCQDPLCPGCERKP